MGCSRGGAHRVTCVRVLVDAERRLVKDAGPMAHHMRMTIFPRKSPFSMSW
jgi:hypothetical protein